MSQPGSTRRSSIALASFQRPGLLGVIVLLTCASSFAARPVSASNIILEWTAPGDDSTFGRASEYDLRWSLHANQFPARFYSAPRIAAPAPSVAGTNERLLVPDLPESTNVYFALRTKDKRGNWSSISNVLGTQVVAGVDGGANRLAFSEASPNPAHHQATFTLALPVREQAVVEAIDVSGRRVRTLARGELPAGEHPIAWDLRDSAGHVAHAGVYFVRARIGDSEFVRRLVIVP